MLVSRYVLVKYALIFMLFELLHVCLHWQVQSFGRDASAPLPPSTPCTIPLIPHTIYVIRSQERLSQWEQQNDIIWRNLEANYTRRFVTINECRALARSFFALESRFDALETMEARVGLCQMLVLYYYGGIVVRTFVEHQQPLEGWFRHSTDVGLLCGEFEEHQLVDWFVAAPALNPCVEHVLAGSTRLTEAELAKGATSGACSCTVENLHGKLAAVQLDHRDLDPAAPSNVELGQYASDALFILQVTQSSSFLSDLPLVYQAANAIDGILDTSARTGNDRPPYVELKLRTPLPLKPSGGSGTGEALRCVRVFRARDLADRVAFAHLRVVLLGPSGSELLNGTFNMLEAEIDDVVTLRVADSPQVEPVQYIRVEKYERGELAVAEVQIMTDPQCKFPRPLELADDENEWANTTQYLFAALTNITYHCPNMTWFGTKNKWPFCPISSLYEEGCLITSLGSTVGFEEALPSSFQCRIDRFGRFDIDLRTIDQILDPSITKISLLKFHLRGGEWELLRQLSALTSLHVDQIIVVFNFRFPDAQQLFPQFLSTTRTLLQQYAVYYYDALHADDTPWLPLPTPSVMKLGFIHRSLVS